MSAATPARRCALSVLALAEREGSYVRDLLDAVQRGEGACPVLEPREAAFCLRLSLGVTAASGCLDEAVNAHLRRPRDVSPRVRQALRIAAFELIYLGTAPEIAVSQGVELVRSQARAASGLANAVLHRVARTRAAFLAAADAAPGERGLVACARRAGLPRWLARACRASVGEAAGGLFASALEPAPAAACVNPRRSAAELPGLGAPAGAPADGIAMVDDPAALIRSGALEAGDAVISDLNAQEVALAVVAPGSCLEIGAGRGTKTFVMAAAAARRGLERRHVAVELSEGRSRENRRRLACAGLDAGIEVLAGDATDLDRALAQLDAASRSRALFDRVLVDAPCSGTGTMRRHPEIPWRLAPGDAEGALPALQGRMLREAAARVAPGGALVFATCSVLRAENDGVVDAFLASSEGSAFRELRRSQTVPAPGAFDGHFFSELVREG